MTDLKSLEQLSLILGYVVPGLIIVWVRAQFLTGRVGPHKDALLSYFTLSAIYLVLAGAVCALITGSDAPLHQQTRYWQAITLGGAAAFGVLVGVNAAFGWSRWLLFKCGVYVPHVLDSAWDWKFSRFSASFVMLTLKDGSKVSGWCGTRSFIGSDPKDRDIYIEQVYDVDDEGTWIARTPGKGIYIAAGEIRTIEFIPPTAADGEKTA